MEKKNNGDTTLLVPINYENNDGEKQPKTENISLYFVCYK